MSLALGVRLGAYDVLSKIGAGGMGEVYKARDTRLNRDVAIKVLPEQFALDADRLARFKREAQILASLNHTNIAGIYGLEESGGVHALVLEFVEGPTLADRIAQGPIPLDEALPITRQIAEALEAAHEHGIVHRDLKPANIKLRPDGTVKVLDFGLAKAIERDRGAGDLSQSPTLGVAATRADSILGTAAYMAPEQAKGTTVDRRADVWAFGAVLYEMLAGKRLFRGDTVAETLASVIKEAPSFALLPPETPPAIRHLLRRCLERDLRRRLPHIAEARIIIEDSLPGATLAEPAAVQGARALGHRAIVLGAGCLLTGSLLMGLLAWSLRPAPPLQPVSRMVIPLPPNEQLRGAVAPMLALSPDGTRLAYIAGTGAQGRIYVRALDSMEARPITGTEGALDPFFSPDGQWIAFFAAGKLKKVSISGEAVLTLCDAPDPVGATWGANDIIVFASGRAGLFQVSAGGGEPQPLTNQEAIETGHYWPQFLPDGKTILYTFAVGVAIATADEAHIAAHRLDTGEQRVLIRGGTFPRYVPTGHLVYYRAGTIMAARFDTNRLEVGTPAPVIEDVMSSAGSAGGTGAAQFSFSTLGSLVYLRGGPQSGQRTLVWVDREGTEVPLPAPRRSYDDLSLSPDGRQVAVQILEPPPASVWIYDIPRSTLTRLTSEGAANLPVWTPDGKRIVFAVSTPGANGLFWKPTDGSGPEERVMTSELPPGPTSVSPDGQTLAFYATTAGTGADLWVVPLHGERKPRPFLQTPFFEVDPMFSPDGRWLAYTSGESGRSEVYVQPYPGPGGKWLISTEGGAEPLWSPNGQELFYRNDDRMMAVDIQTQPAFKAGTPRILFDKPGYFGGAGADHDISPDGQRFLMIKETEQQGTALTQINVVLNWFEELKRRVPTN